ncbi:cilia- and flagella-associated protein 58-like isoform X2 [Ostrea edulis]|nr:cilia- and flagella-associated protein 58-like isoform X2 [Ostrea edulis]XP_048763112.2 cilia- and flagella-associated protein 58-like isoform X2 [Ostrea edulis]XP_048763113.2 cilia- and flagella-associated protein 58-like isoform X2 [Ostrea edulis]
MQKDPKLVGGSRNTLNADLVVDGDFSIKQPTVQNLVPNQKGHIVLSMFQDFQIGNNSMDPGSFHSPSQGSLSMESKRREQMLADLWTRNSGVSQNQFLSVVRELKRAKNTVKEQQQRLALYKNASVGDRQIETNNAVEERMKAQQIEICDLKQRIENLQVHKKQMKTDIEGVSVAPASNSFELPRTSRENSFSKEDCEVSRREKQLLDEIHNWKQKVESLKMENTAMKENYTKLQKSLEDQRFSSIQKWSELSQENAKFRKDLNEAEEDRNMLLEQVEQLNNQLKDKERKLHRMHESYEQAIQDRNVYDQRIAEMKARQVQKTNPLYSSSPKPVVSRVTRPNYSEHGGRTNSTVEDLHEALREFQRQPSHNPKTYRCSRCYEDFTSEQAHLEHIQKCYD